jgi:Protein of unknown function (DUF1700)
MNGTPEDHVETYLRRLDHELRDLPRAARRDVLEEVSGHVEEARAEGAMETEADVLNVLDRLGDPEEIAREAKERFGVRPRGGGAHEIAAIVLLLVGGFIAGIGWLVGLVLLWTSQAWTTRDKLIGTLVPPGGLAFVLVLWSGTLVAEGAGCVESLDPSGAVTETTCEQGAESGLAWLWFVVFVAITVAPIFTAIYLGRRMRRVPPPATVTT